MKKQGKIPFGAKSAMLPLLANWIDGDGNVPSQLDGRSHFVFPQSGDLVVNYNPSDVSFRIRTLTFDSGAGNVTVTGAAMAEVVAGRVLERAGERVAKRCCIRRQDRRDCDKRARQLCRRHDAARARQVSRPRVTVRRGRCDGRFKPDAGCIGGDAKRQCKNQGVRRDGVRQHPERNGSRRQIRPPGAAFRWLFCPVRGRERPRIPRSIVVKYAGR